jgi:HSP20 family protein
MKVKIHVTYPLGESASERLPFRALQQEVDVFSDFGSDLPLVGRWNGIGRLAMQVDVAGNRKALEVTAELPGVNEKE